MPTLLLMLLLVGPGGEDTPAIPLDEAPIWIKSYVAAAATQRPARLSLWKGRLKDEERTAARTKADKAAKAKRVKDIRRTIKKLEDEDEFVPPTTTPQSLKAGYCGRVELPEELFGEKASAVAEILQIIDETNMIVEVNRRTFWLGGLATAGLTDGATMRLAGAWHVTGNKTYQTVAGGSKTVLALEFFDESAALPYLQPPQRKSLKDFLAEEDAK